MGTNEEKLVREKGFDEEAHTISRAIQGAALEQHLSVNPHTQSK